MSEWNDSKSVSDANSPIECVSELSGLRIASELCETRKPSWSALEASIRRHINIGLGVLRRRQSVE